MYKNKQECRVQSETVKAARPINEMDKENKNERGCRVVLRLVTIKEYRIPDATSGVDVV